MPQAAFFTGPLYEKMSEDLHLTGKAQGTHDGYLREIRKLADFCQRSPDQISEAQMRRYFLHLKNQRHFAAGSL
ncbi:MAG: phage integrase N-terminal SAM-like domain-containing protein, partial [Fuerstiella sp.]